MIDTQIRGCCRNWPSHHHNFVTSSVSSSMVVIGRNHTADYDLVLKFRWQWWDRFLPGPTLQFSCPPFISSQAIPSLCRKDNLWREIAPSRRRGGRARNKLVRSSASVGHLLKTLKTHQNADCCQHTKCPPCYRQALKFELQISLSFVTGRAGRKNVQFHNLLL